MKVNNEKLNEYLKKIGAPVCPLCKHNHWTVSDTVFQLMEFNEGSIVIGGQLYPVLPIACENCGNTYFVNAIVAGFVEQNKEDAGDGK